MGRLLEQEARPAPASPGPQEQEAPLNPAPDTQSSAALFATIFSRCKDVSPSVRSQALRVLADVTAEPGIAVSYFRLVWLNVC